MDEKIKDLNLLLLYLCGWQEDSRQSPGEKIFRSWKGFPFSILNQLEEEKMIRQIKNGKSVIITDLGQRRAQQLKEKLLNGNQANQAAGTASKHQEDNHASEW